MSDYFFVLIETGDGHGNYDRSVELGKASDDIGVAENDLGVSSTLRRIPSTPLANIAESKSESEGIHRSYSHSRAVGGGNRSCDVEDNEISGLTRSNSECRNIESNAAQQNIRRHSGSPSTTNPLVRSHSRRSGSGDFQLRCFLYFSPCA